MANYDSTHTGIQTDNYDNRIATLETQNLQSQITALQNTISTQATTISTLQNSIASLQNQINNMQPTKGTYYMKFPNGFLIQWGAVTNLNSGGWAQLNFPVSFKNGTVPTLIASARYGSNSGYLTLHTTCQVNGVSGGYVYIRNNSGSVISSDTSIYWIAIGYWQ